MIIFYFIYISPMKKIHTVFVQKTCSFYLYIFCMAIPYKKHAEKVPENETRKTVHLQYKNTMINTVHLKYKRFIYLIFQNYTFIKQ